MSGEAPQSPHQESSSHHSPPPPPAPATQTRCRDDDGDNYGWLQPRNGGARADGQPVKYRLLHANEIDAWLDHVHGVFAAAKGERAPPRAYFARHVRNDPAADLPNSVVVAVVRGDGARAPGGERIVGTVRVFRRRMYSRGGTVQVGGVGEVSVKTEYRRRGIAQQLLRASVALMERDGFALSTLHTSNVAPVYASLGWLSVPRCKARIERCVRASADSGVVRPLRLARREAGSGDDSDMAACVRMYDTFSRRFDGPFVRDERAYWHDWVHDECGGVAWAPNNRTPRARITAARDAYMVAQHRDDDTDDGGAECRDGPATGAIHIREFAVDDGRVADAARCFDLLVAAIAHAIEWPPLQLGGDGVATRRQVTVVLAAPLLDALNLRDGNTTVRRIDVDRGAMYRVINPTLLIRDGERGDGRVSGDNAADFAAVREDKHVFWDTDAF